MVVDVGFYCHKRKLKFEMVRKENQGEHLYPPCMSPLPQSAFVLPRSSWRWWQTGHAHAEEGQGFVTFSEISAVLFLKEKNAPDQRLYLLSGLWGKEACHLHWPFLRTLSKSLCFGQFFLPGILIKWIISERSGSVCGRSAGLLPATPWSLHSSVDRLQSCTAGQVHSYLQI